MKVAGDINQATIQNTADLEDLLSRPTPGVIETMAKADGDVIVLGVGGKMGPSLARMLRRATDEARVKRRVIGVSRFSSSGLDKSLQSHGVETISADLLDPRQLDRLPDCPNVIYMAGMKFGSTGNEALTWAMNSYLPGMVSQKYRGSRIVAFSTGNIYGLVPVSGGGSVETDPLNPAGDYAMSCLGRERIFEHFSRTLSIPMSMIRLNYAVEMRYGVLYDLARRIMAGETIDLAMGNANVIWQGDANAMAIQSIPHASTPPFVINVAGPEMMSVRRVAEQFGKLLGREVKLTGTESPTALLSNGQLGHRLFGYPRVPVQQVIHWIADWVQRGGDSLGKPTHFETRDVNY